MLKEKLEADLKSALKAGERARVSVLRMVVSAIRNKEIEKQKKDTGLPEADVLAVLQSEVKKRKDSVEGFRKGGREEMAQKEEAEVEVIKMYLPAEASDDDIRAAVEKAVQETGASGPSDFGRAMKAAMVALKGQADGNRVSRALKAALGG